MQVYVMFMITNLIEPRMGKLLSGVLQRTSGQLLFQTDFRKWLFGTLCLDSRFQNPPWLSNITKTPVAFKTEFQTQFGPYAVFEFNP